MSSFDAAQKQKERIGRRQFNISESEQLVIHCSCKYKSKISAPGALWVFSGTICYYGNLFSIETKIRIKISEIESVVASGNTSIEMMTFEHETHKFSGFPNQETRRRIIEYISNQRKRTFSPSHQSHKSMNDAHLLDTHSRAKSNSSTRSHSNSVGSLSPQRNSKSETNISNRTANIHPLPPSIPTSHSQETFSKQHKHGSNGHTNTKTIGNGHINEQKHSKKVRRSTIDSTKYKYELPSIHSQQSLRLLTPRVDSNDSDDMEINDNEKSTNQGEKEGFNILLLEPSLSIHSDDAQKGRLRSWSDSDMPHHHDESPPSTKSQDVVSDHSDDSISKRRRWFNNIFKFSKLKGFSRTTKSLTMHPFNATTYSDVRLPKQRTSTKQNKKRECNGSSSLGQIERKTVIESVDDDKNNAKTHINAEQATETKVNEDHEQNHENIAPDSLDEYIDEQYKDTEIHLGGFQNENWQPLYSDDFWTTPAKFFHEAYSETFIKKMHSERGTIGLKIGPWEVDTEDDKIPSDQPTVYIRKIEFVSKIKDPPPFVPAKTEVYQTQRFRFYGRDRVVIDVSISTPNIKYGDHFLLVHRYFLTVNEEDDSKTHLECCIAFKWIKKTWFEKIIVSKATSETEEGVALWASKCHELFPPKISNQAILQKQISQKDVLSHRRVIDKKVIDYFHTERTRKDIVFNDWIKPFFQIIFDIFCMILKPSSWKDLFKQLRKINDIEEHDHLITLKHGLLGLTLFVFIFVLVAMCWMFVWIWQTMSFTNALLQQNEILMQQTAVFEQLLNKLMNDNQDQLKCDL